jgi:hypothetical protein
LATGWCPRLPCWYTNCQIIPCPWPCTAQNICDWWCYSVDETTFKRQLIALTFEEIDGPLNLTTGATPLLSSTDNFSAPG